MRKLHGIILLGTIFLFAPNGVYAQDDEVNKTLDVLLERFTTLFNKHDAKGLSKQYAQDANVLYTDGKQMNSRKEVHASFVEFFEKNPNVKTRFSTSTGATDSTSTPGTSSNERY